MDAVVTDCDPLTNPLSVKPKRKWVGCTTFKYEGDDSAPEDKLLLSFTFKGPDKRKDDESVILLREARVARAEVSIDEAEQRLEYMLSQLEFQKGK